MFAVIRTGGKQYKVKEGDVLEVERLEVKKDQKVTFEDILLVDDEKTTWIGNPILGNTRVQAVVLDNFKDEKIIIFKKKRRKQYKRTLGHRQALTRVKIEKILVGKEAVAKPKPAEKPVAAKPAPPKRTKPKAAGPRKTPAKKPAKGATAVKAKVAPKSAKVKSAPPKKKTVAKAAKSKTQTKES